MQAQYWRRATLVIIEYGGSWPRWLSPERGNMAVVAQHYEGPPSSLVTQVATRLTKLESMGWRFESIVLVSNGRSDADACASRSILARGLAARLASTYSGSLVLSADEHADRRAVHALVGLAAALDGTAHPGIELSLRIGKGDPIRSNGHVAEPLANAS
jgi:hypothetical protein